VRSEFEVAGIDPNIARFGPDFFGEAPKCWDVDYDAEEPSDNVAVSRRSAAKAWRSGGEKKHLP